MRALTYLLATCLLASCATQPQKLATPSGRPEVYIANATPKEAIDAITAAKLQKGLAIKSVNDYAVTFATRIEGSLSGSLLFGSSYDRNPEARFTYTVVNVPGGIRVYSKIEMVTNPGSAFERSSDITTQMAVRMQSELEELRAQLAR